MRAIPFTHEGMPASSAMRAFAASSRLAMTRIMGRNSHAAPRNHAGFGYLTRVVSRWSIRIPWRATSAGAARLWFSSPSIAAPGA
jgi:hypothetical protein